MNMRVGEKPNVSLLFSLSGQMEIALERGREKGEACSKAEGWGACAKFINQPVEPAWQSG